MGDVELNIPGRVYGYARVSTEDQNLDRQIDELSAAGAEIIIEEKKSGGPRSRRPKWESLIDPTLGPLRKNDTLMVVELSRLGRSTSQLSTLLQNLKDRGINLRILNLGIDTNTAAGELIFNVLAAVSQMERDLISERTRSALAAKKRRGERVGGRDQQFSRQQILRAMNLMETTDMTAQEVANAVGISRTHMYARIKEEKQRQETETKETK